ncbi:class I SAM-dependent methyltransferase [bacterium]|nr:MAG: class I SAM-dependent methyltransferase [bacterium]
MKTLRCFLTLNLSLIFFSGCSAVWTAGEVPFVPTPLEVVDRMLELAELKKGDVVYDLGSGDGRIVIRAAKKYGARGVGVEIDGDLIQRSRSKAREEGVKDLVEFREQDALKVDVSPATVVTLYMLPEFNEKLRPILWKQLKPGSRVVSHDFTIEGWTPIKVEKIRGGLLHDHTIFLWKIEGESK